MSFKQKKEIVVQTRVTNTSQLSENVIQTVHKELFNDLLTPKIK